ncbi:MAG: capsule assembly Wzi family protein [Rhodothermia bacterium]|nr:MAG: capsule assembly Wzi family protein [Rhodothermia bacterium]
MKSGQAANLRFGFLKPWLSHEGTFICFLVLLAALNYPRRSSAQVRSLQIEAQTIATASDATGQPFWIITDRNGIFDSSGSGALVRINASYTYKESRNWYSTVAADVIARASPNSSTFFHQLYAAAQYRAFELTLGWREHTAGLVDSTLSTGSMIFSRNAATIPRISIGTPGFTNVPGTFGLIAFKGFWSHGWMGSKRFVRNPFLHEKSLHLRVFGPADFPVLGYAGITHAVIWGGRHPEFGSIPAGLSDYVDVVLGRPGEGQNLETQPTGTLGNSVAAIDFALQINLKRARTLLYRQFYAEAQSDIRFRNAADGIWGISVTRKGRSKLINHALWEFIYTKRQGDRVAGEPRTDFSAYYANSVYRTGWTHRGRTLGNPLLFSDGSLDRPVKNTILVAHHVGLEGELPGNLQYKALATYSRNYGTRDDCTDNGCTGNPQYYTGRLDQYSFLFEVNGPLPIHDQLSFSAAVALDTGELYKDTFGGMFGVIWTNNKKPTEGRIRK